MGFRKITILLVIAALFCTISMAWAVEDEDDPPAPEYTSDKALAPVFSQTGGWFQEGFQLSLSTKEQGAVVYYTLDGSVPDETSQVYREPIDIKDRTRDANNISNIQTGTWNNPPKNKVFKGTVVRARVIKEGVEPSDVITHTYFVSKEGSRYSFPVISLAVEPDDFFGYERGIYVPGKIYDDKFDGNKNDWERDANYNQRGPEWERAAHIEFFDTDGSLGFAQNVGVRIHGGATRSNAQKSLRIYTRTNLDTEKNIHYEIFPGLTKADGKTPQDKFKRILIRNSGNDWYYTMFRDALMQSLVDDVGIDTQATRPAIIFINGEYWGLQNIRERYDRYYIQNKYNVDDNRVVMLEGDGWLSEGVYGDETHYRDMLTYLRNNDMTEDAHYKYIQTQMDVDNFIDYQISQIYFANDDWPGNNIEFWRIRTDSYLEGAGYLDGRWRWMLFDTDFGFGLYDGTESYRHPTLSFAMEAGGTGWPNPDWSTLILRTLMKNREFKISFVNRFADLLNTSFKPSRVTDKIDKFQSIYEPEIEEHINRWNTHGSIQDWKWKIGELRAFAKHRPGSIYLQMVNILDQEGTYRLELLCDEGMGYIQVNSINITSDSHGITGEAYPWSGVYFKNTPITLTAHPKDGYSFAGWEGLEGEDSSQPEVKLHLREGTMITARFERIGGEAFTTEEGSPIYIVTVIILLLVIISALLAIRISKDKRR